MESAKVNLDLLFETSWEVCNKIGGIYTVLSTKAKTLQKLYKDRVVFIGPDVWSAEHPSPWFTPSRTLLKDWLAQASLPEGVSVRVGRWNVPGKPIAVLVKFDGMYAVKDEFYGEMWRRFGVDSLHAYGDYDEGCAFAHAAGVVIKSICDFQGIQNKNVIAHFDEWTTAMGLLYVKWQLPQVATVFTTHATCIGRSICGNGKPLYDYLKGYNGDQMARELNMESKHSLEKAAAHQADCFTTVSDITADECEQLLELRPQVVTPNGFEGDFVPSRTKFAAARAEARKSLLDVASALTGKSYTDKTFLIATSGRCEYRNKGLDVFLDSMVRLTDLKPGVRTVAFVMVPAWSKCARPDLAERIGERRREALPDPVITHELNEPWTDAVYNRIKGLHIDNAPDRKVDVIYVPCYLNGNDGIFNRDYYATLIGMDATVFPSYYEPWGYTPLESVAFGVPTVTTSLSGFGQWVLKTFDNQFEACGVNVTARGDFNYDAVVDSIARSLKFLTVCDSEQRAIISKAAVTTAATAAWKYFIEYYVEAYTVALTRAAARCS
nr:glycosyltransferase [Bacteroides sp.]